MPVQLFFFCFSSPLVPQQQYQNGESEENHEQFLKALQNSVTTFLNRMKSNHMRGRSITNDSAVLSLFQSINNMHPQLLDILNQLDEKRRESWPWGGGGILLMHLTYMLNGNMISNFNFLV